MLTVFGDLHLNRNLPYSRLKDGEDLRYQRRLGLLKKVFRQPSIFLGDITHNRNTIDGKILEDAYEIFKDKEAYIVLGNHDRSADNEKYTSLAEILDQTIDSVTTVEDIEAIKREGYTLVFSSYYCDENELKDFILKQKGSKPIIVFGHWNFFNQQYQEGKKLQNFAAKHENIKWVLGHEHNPRKLKYGAYLGPLQPVQFRERQGKVMKIKNGKVSFIEYPWGEKFKIITADEDPLQQIENPELTYLRVETKKEGMSEKIREYYTEQGVQHLIINLVMKDVKERKELESLSKRDLEDYVRLASEAHDYDPEEIMPKHQEVKEEVENVT